MQLYLFAHVFNSIEIEKRSECMGTIFEDVTSSLNWMNPVRDVTDLIRQLEVLTVIKYSPRWYNILKTNRRQRFDH